MLQNLEDTLEIHKNTIGKNTKKSEKYSENYSSKIQKNHPANLERYSPKIRFLEAKSLFYL